MPIEVKEYACEYCNKKGFFSIKDARAHEEKCIKNPKISEEWEPCFRCQGTGNHFGRQRPGVIGYARCSSCGGSGRRKKMTKEQINTIREAVQKAMEKREAKEDDQALS
jgi:hypothetical protein